MPAKYTRDDAKITVVVNGQTYDGWLQSEVERSLESLAGTFSIPVSLVPGNPPAIKRQDAVEVRIGTKAVINGYVLAAEPFYSQLDCGMHVVGRDRTGDLVRCSAIFKGGQWRNVKIDRIIKDIVQPFGLDVVVDTDIGGLLQDFKLNHGETALDAVSRAARLRGVLVTRDDAGRVLLTRAGQLRFKGSIVRGQNVISMAGAGTDDNRHSQYFAYGQSNTIADFEAARSLKATSVDEEMKRYLPLVINAEGNTTGGELQTLVDHTKRVRRGHAYGMRYRVDGWTFEGEPWPLNQRVVIYDDVAGLDGTEWLICAVKQSCDLKYGDVTDLLVRPIESYDTAPLKTKLKRRNWGNRGNTTNHPRGPHDKAQGGR
jgi:prophage tail gpP-like protein